MVNIGVAFADNTQTFAAFTFQEQGTLGHNMLVFDQPISRDTRRDFLTKAPATDKTLSLSLPLSP